MKPSRSWWGRLRDAVRALSMTCREAVRAESRELDGPLPGWQRVGLFLHRCLCPWCRRYGRQIRFLRTAWRHPAPPPPTPLPSPGARERWMKAMRAAETKGASRPETLSGPADDPPPHFKA